MSLKNMWPQKANYHSCPDIYTKSMLKLNFSDRMWIFFSPCVDIMKFEDNLFGKKCCVSPQNFLKQPLIFAQYPSSEDNGTVSGLLALNLSEIVKIQLTFGECL